ncbi:NHLP leader peptide family RiPP precursor [Chryseobacterium sp. MEBOG06]|uniref:NHLP leader peptide family RiPP precursor n=1 Tax=Chryseobacterium sp. MEBOG06 TaxID=2879938 RepID=UPI001F3C09BD|nr:NHLP leader peptide family RiPP precursor [Chryseobacterium sp. MEBOG06]UKB83915.1 NHLP leader peptide family RiPP precursor [Chryseobacterium sp. MEBOG06]
MEFTQEEKVYVEIVQKAWDDAEFKKELIANPVATIEKFIGKKLNLPEGKTLVVRDQSDGSSVYINIPAKVEVDAELNEEQLEAVAGGVWIGPDGGGCIPTFPPKPLSPGPFLTALS